MTGKSKKMKIIVVDDISSMRTLVVQFLKKISSVEIIGEAVNGDDAVQQALTKHPDILLTDLSLPDKSGLDVLKEIKSAKPDISVYLFSAYDVDEIKEFQNGNALADGFIHKSNLKLELEAMIQKELTKRASRAG